MLRRTTRNQTRNEENADQIRQRKKDSGTTQQLSEAALLRSKDVNKQRSLNVDSEKSIKGDDKSYSSNSPNNTQKSKIKVFTEEVECQPRTPKSTSETPPTATIKTRSPLGSVTPTKRTLQVDEQQSLSAKRFESYHSEEEEEHIDETEEEGLVVLPSVELDLPAFNTSDDELLASPKKKDIRDTLKEKTEEVDALDETSLPSEVEYANPHEEELPLEPPIKVDLSGFSGALPNIGAYEIKALDPYDLVFDDDDVVRMVQGSNAVDNEEGENEEEVFVLASEPFSPSLEPKDDDPIEIPFSDCLFDVEGTKVGVDTSSPAATPH